MILHQLAFFLQGSCTYEFNSGMNKGKFISTLMKDWKPEGEKKWNPDDFMKFIRWSQWRLLSSGCGVLGFITNNVFIDSITGNEMRKSLVQSSKNIHVLNLHGGIYEKEHDVYNHPTNVFDITKPVAISIFLFKSDATKTSAVYFQDKEGTRQDKTDYLTEHCVNNIQWQVVDDIETETCLGKQWYFKNIVDTELSEYCSLISLKDIFLIVQSGIKTDRDELFYDYSAEVLRKRMNVFYSPIALEEPFKSTYRVLDSSSYKILNKRKKSKYMDANISKVVLRPFDSRYVYYNKDIISRPAWDIMQHINNKQNLLLLSMRQYVYDVPEYCYVYLSESIVDCRVFLSERGIACASPLYLYPISDLEYVEGALGGRRPNLNEKFIAALTDKLGLEWIADGRGNLGISGDDEAISNVGAGGSPAIKNGRRAARPTANGEDSVVHSTFGPEDVFNYMYAVFHSPTYRERYSEFLRIDFPRLPLTSNLDMFRDLCAQGDVLVKLHLMDESFVMKRERLAKYALPKFEIAKYSKGDDNIVEKPRWAGGKVWINKEQYFEGVAEEIFHFHVGGYQVCDKWLKDRRGRVLTSDDIKHYQMVCSILAQTIRVMADIDTVIDKHTGWPIE